MLVVDAPIDLLPFDTHRHRTNFLVNTHQNLFRTVINSLLSDMYKSSLLAMLKHPIITPIRFLATNPQTNTFFLPFDLNFYPPPDLHWSH